jgi:cellulase
VRRLEGGVKGEELYGSSDEGILVDVHGKIQGYKIPGPKVWAYATPVKQANQ